MGSGRLELLRDRRLRLLVVGQAASGFGSSVATVALVFAALEAAGGSASAVGWVLAANRFPLLVFLLLGGVLGDRLPRARVMIASDLVRFATQGTAAALLLAGRAGLGTLLVLFAVHGAAGAFFNPAADGLVRGLVPVERLQPANALVGLARTSTAIGGQAFGGALVALAGVGWAFALDAVTFAVSAVALVAIGVKGTVAARPAASSVLREAGEGLRAVRERTWLWVGVLFVGLLNPLAMVSFFALGPVVADRSLGGAGVWGAVGAGFGIGMVGGGLVALRGRPRRPLVVCFGGSLLQIPQLALLALAAPAPLVVVAAVLGGAQASYFNAVWAAAEQGGVPADVVSRVSSLGSVGTLALAPLAYAVVGPIADRIGLAAPLWFGAAWILCSTAAVLAVPAIRSYGARPAAAAPARAW
ncbi:MAG TPA: MFS transporter [Gaiellaceae bacterium]|nr:MFS transporter [Gaiellaceae bacterium]